MIFGTPVYHIDIDRTDRIGIRTLGISRMWQPSQGGLSIAELDAEEPPPPFAPGGVAYFGKSRSQDGGAMSTHWSFEGVDGDGKSPSCKTRGNSIDFSFQGGFQQVSVGIRPDFQSLLTDYAGSTVDGEIYFMPFLPDASGSTGGSPKKQCPAQTKPDVRAHDLSSARWHLQDSIRFTDPPTLTGQAGKIVTTPPGQPPIYADRDWLLAPLDYRFRDTIFDNTETCWLSGEGGCCKPLYKGSGGTSSGGFGPGFSQGSLLP
jgi:hypothetical protein